MKKFVITFVSMLLVLSFVTACGGESEDGPKVKYLEEWQVGGMVFPSDDFQLFSRIAILSQETDEKFSAEVTKKPENIDIVKKEDITLKRHYFNFYIKADESQAGIYPFEVTLTSKNNTHKVDGTIEVLKESETIDNLFGGPGRSNELFEFDFEGKDIVASSSLDGEFLTGPAGDGEFIYACTKDGEIIKLDSGLNEVARSVATEHSIEKLQVFGDYIFVSDVKGSVFLFAKADIGNERIKPVSRLNLKSRLSTDPTVISENTLIVGTKDGNILSISVPKLKINWKYNVNGEILSHAVSVGDSSGGDEKGIIVAASDDRNVYFIDLEGNLVTMEREIMDFVKSVSIADGKVVFATGTNQVMLRSLYDLIIHDMWVEKNIDEGIAFNGDYILTTSGNRFVVLSAIDGYIQLDINLEASVTRAPVILGDKALLFLDDETVRIIDFMDGQEYESFNFSGNPIGWPVLVDGKLILMNESGYLVAFGQRGKTALTGQVDLSTVKYFGGRGDLRHTGSFKFSTPDNPSIILEIPGNFAAPVITKNYLILYDINKEEFSLRSQKDGGIVWHLNERAAFGIFLGAGLNAGPHECPIFVSDGELYLATQSGLKLVDPNSGKIIKESHFVGIPQIDDEVIILTSGFGIICLDKKMSELWSKPMIGVTSGQLCIDENEVIVFDRNGDESKIYVIEKLTGNVLFEENDNMLQFGTKLTVSNKTIATGTHAGMWLMNRNPYRVYGVVNGTNRALNPLVVDGVVGSITENMGILKKMNMLDSFTEIDVFHLPELKEGDIFYNYFTGNDYIAGSKIVCIAEIIDPSKFVDGKHNGEPEFYLVIREKLSGKVVSEVLINDTAVVDYAMTANDDLIAVCQQGPSPKLMLIGEE